jgi:Uncharacterised protein family (UPF0150).
VHSEFTAVFERDDDWHIAYSPEIPGANGQGRTRSFFTIGVKMAWGASPQTPKARR